MTRKLLFAGLAVTLAAAAAAATAAAATLPSARAAVTPAAVRAGAAGGSPLPSVPPRRRSSCANRTLVELAAATPDLSLFTTAVAAVGGGLAATLNDAAASRTVFTPTNSAFVALARTFGYDGPRADEAAAWAAIVAALTKVSAGQPLPLLRTILAYHVLAGGAADGGAVRVAELAGAGAQATREGGTLSVRPDRTVVDRAPEVPDAVIVLGDVEASNGLAHLVDRVLLPTAFGASLVLPPPASVTLVQLASVTPELSLLVRALNATGLRQLIANPAGNVTVLPPTNAAWVALAERLGYASCGGCAAGDDDAAYEYLVATLAARGGGDPLPPLTTLLSYHLLPRRAPLAALVAAGPLVTLRGSRVEITRDLRVVDRAPGVPDGLVVEANVATSNGIAHLVNRVLLPMPLESIVGGGGD